MSALTMCCTEQQGMWELICPETTNGFSPTSLKWLSQRFHHVPLNDYSIFHQWVFCPKCSYHREKLNNILLLLYTVSRSGTSAVKKKNTTKPSISLMDLDSWFCFSTKSQYLFVSELGSIAALLPKFNVLHNKLKVSWKRETLFSNKNIS